MAHNRVAPFLFRCIKQEFTVVFFNKNDFRPSEIQIAIEKPKKEY